MRQTILSVLDGAAHVPGLLHYSLTSEGFCMLTRVFHSACAAISSVTLLTAFHCAQAQTITWAGHTWKVTSGSMAGVAPGNPANVELNPDGYLHLQIANREGKWTAAEL